MRYRRGVTGLPRRGFLALTGITAVSLTGCQVNDPRILGGPTAAPPAPAPTPAPASPGLRVSLAHEAELAALSDQLVRASGTLGLPAAQRAVAGWMAQAFEMHVVALLARRPELRPTVPPTPEPGWAPEPRPTPTIALPAGNRDQALRTLLAQLADAGTDHRRNALSTTGSATLLWGSLAAYTDAAAAAMNANTARPEPPTVPLHAMTPASDMEATQQTLRQVHALIYGYQVALPWFRGPEFQSTYDTLVQRRDLRDRLTNTLREAAMIAPAAEAAYALPVIPRDRATAAELLWRMETAFAPFAGAWLAAATDGGTRERALQALTEATVLGVRWGGPLVVWPGWPA